MENDSILAAEEEEIEFLEREVSSASDSSESRRKSGTKSAILTEKSTPRRDLRRKVEENRSPKLKSPEKKDQPTAKRTRSAMEKVEEGITVEKREIKGRKKAIPRRNREKKVEIEEKEEIDESDTTEMTENE